MTDRRFRVLKHLTIIICEGVNGVKWMPMHAFPGSVIELIDTEPSPITDEYDEHTIHWSDCVGRVTKGWIASTTKLGKTEETACRYVTRTPDEYDERLPTTPWDDVRFKAGKLLYEDAKRGPQLHSLIRRLGDRLKTSDEALTLFNQELNMSKDTEVQDVADLEPKQKKAKKSAKKGTKSATKKAAKPKAEKKAKKEKVSGDTGLSALPQMLRDAGAKEGIALAKQVAAGETLSRKKYETLRDNVNAAAAKVRDSDGSLASRLSAANRSVRRLCRSCE